MVFDTAAFVTVIGHDYRIDFWFMTKNNAADTVKMLISVMRVDYYENEKNICYSDEE